MGNSFGFLRSESGNGFQFAVVEACKAEDVDLSQTCNLTFGANHELVSIGNVTRGTMLPQPGIAGIGIWIAMVLFFAVIIIALIFVSIEFVSMTNASESNLFAMFRDKPGKDPKNPNADPGWKDKVRATGRTFVLSVADAQTIFVGAFLLGFAGQNKCKLTSYHFTVAVSQMMIALSVITFSVALVRTYWRSPFAAAFRLVLSIGSFVGVGLTIFRQSNYAPVGSMTNSNRDSAILLPVACLLETELRIVAEKQAQDSKADLGFENGATWPPERIFYIFLVVAFLSAHISIPIRFRFGKSRDRAPEVWTNKRLIFTSVYWLWVLVPPILTSIICWIRVYQLRKWIDESGWMADPNTEMMIWDSGQLIAMGVLITVIMNVLTEAKEREKKGAKKKSEDEAHELLLVKSLLPSHTQVQEYGYEPDRSFNTSRER